MNYAPMFSQIADSSLWEEPYHVRILFVTMMAKKQADHVVYADEYRLKKWSNLYSMEEVMDALDILSSPDPKRPGQQFDGRRIQKVDGGWLVLNGEYYEELMQIVNERCRKARWAREQRRKAKEAKKNKGNKFHPLKGEAAHDRAIRDGREADAQHIIDNQPGL